MCSRVKSHAYCCVPGCHDTTSSRYKIPVMPVPLLEKWIDRIGNPLLGGMSSSKITSKYRVCARHFQSVCFSTMSPRLVKNSIPSKNIPGYDGSVELDCFFIPTDSTITPPVPRGPRSDDVSLHEVICPGDAETQVLPNVQEKENLVSSMNTPVRTFTEGKKKEVDSQNINLITRPTQDSSLNLKKVKQESTLPKRSKGIVSVCSVCKFSFIKRRDFRKHVETVGCRGSEAFPCDGCNESFVNTKHLRRHKEIHNGIRQTYICNTCNTEFNRRSNLIDHIRKMSCSSRKRLRERLNSVTRICTICNTSFNSPKDFKKHLKTMGCKGSEMFPCNVCNKSFLSTQRLKTHQKTHDVTREKYVCNTCHTEFTSKSNLAGHLKKQSNCTQKRSTMIHSICSVCKISISEYGGFKKHLETVGCGGSERFPCDLCSKSFTQRSTLKKHTGRHSETRQKYICETCNAEFVLEDSLKKHLMANCKRKLIRSICSICTSSFNKREVFREHAQIVGCGGKERFPCDICNMSFTLSCNLKKHKRIHNGTRRKFCCDTCNAQFYQKVNLMKHLRMKSNCLERGSKFISIHNLKENLKTVGCGGSERFPCNICSKSFTHLEYLKKHKEVHDATRRKYFCESCNAQFSHRKRCICQHNHLNSLVKYTCYFCNSSFGKRWDLKIHFKTVGCGSECDKDQNLYRFLLRDNTSVIPGKDRSAATNPSPLIQPIDVSPSMSTSEDTLRVYVFKNTNSIDFQTFLSSKVDDIKKTLHAEFQNHCNEEITAEPLTGDVEYTEIEGKIGKEVLETLGRYKSRFVPIYNIQDIDNNVEHLIQEAFYGYQKEGIQ